MRTSPAARSSSTGVDPTTVSSNSPRVRAPKLPTSVVAQSSPDGDTDESFPDSATTNTVPSLATAALAPTAFETVGSCSSLKPSTPVASMAQRSPPTGSDTTTVPPPCRMSNPGGTAAAEPRDGIDESTGDSVPLPVSSRATVVACWKTSKSAEVAVTDASSVIEG